MDRIHVFFACNDKYETLLVACVRSILLNTRTSSLFFFHIINDAMSENAINEINLIVKEYHSHVMFYNPPKLPPDSQLAPNIIDKSTYYRLFIASLVPDDIHKIIYLDSDIIVRDDLKKLWDISIDGYILGGVRDVNIIQCREAVGIENSCAYVNAGVLLINLKLWRKNNLETQFVKYLNESNWKVEFNDQGVINHVCKGRIHILNPQYNYMMPYHRYSRKTIMKYMKTTMFYDEEELVEAKKAPVVIHYAGPPIIKPWYRDADSMYTEEFLKYYNYSEKHNLISQPTGFKERIRRLIFYLPTSLCAYMCMKWDYLAYKKRVNKTK